ncbi:MAG: hypothetical protein II932_09760, partial [Treponema sp.]|nr:hypothetical protein [Treponema sp.]
MKNNSAINRLPLSLFLRGYAPLTEGVAAAVNGSLTAPIDVKGLKGSLPLFFISMYMEKNAERNASEAAQADYVIVTPGQKECDECESDLETILGPAVSIYKLPWWGSLPYRSTAPGSSVFGERAGFLARLCVRNSAGAKPRVFIVPQRALLTPLPPPEYERSLLQKLEKGQTMDTLRLAEKLVSLGYTRVPRVTVKGEFALRGEVLDIFMPGERSAYRIQFDFDAIEQIKFFDPETQGTKSNGELLDSLILYPMKEVVWDDALCGKLEQLLEKEDREGISESSNAAAAADIHLGLTEEGRKEKDRLLTELAVNRSSEGEELYYGNLWDRQYGLMDYIKEETPVFFLDFDRLRNAVQMIANEYASAYRLARQKLPVLKPKAMLLNFETTVRYMTNSMFFRTIETDA